MYADQWIETLQTNENQKTREKFETINSELQPRVVKENQLSDKLIDYDWPSVNKNGQNQLSQDIINSA